MFRNDDEKKIPGTFKDAIKTELTHLTPVALIKSMNAIDTLNQRSLFAKAGEEIEGEEEIRVPGVDLEKAMERQSFKKLAKQWSDNQYIRNIIKNEIFQTFDDNLVAPEKIARARDLDFIGSTGMHARSTVKRLLRGRTAAALLRHLSQPPHEQDHTDLYELRNL